MAIFVRKASRALEEAKRVQDDAQKIQSDLEQLKLAVERVKLINISIWQIVKEHYGLRDVDLLKRIEALEKLYDDEAKPELCVLCGRPIHVKKKRCIFCGAEQPRSHDIYHLLFDK